MQDKITQTIQSDSIEFVKYATIIYTVRLEMQIQ